MKPNDEQQQRGPWGPIFLAFVSLAFICLGLVLLTLGYFALFLVIAGVIFGFAMLHYVVWGWWLGDVIRRQVEEEDAELERRRGLDKMGEPPPERFPREW